MAVGQRSSYLQGFPGPPYDGAALQQHAQAVDQSRRQLPEIGDRALPNAFAFAITLAKEHRRRGTTIRDHVDEHGLTESQSESCRKRRVWTHSERREKHKSPIPSKLSCSPKRKLRFNARNAAAAVNHRCALLVSMTCIFRTAPFGRIGWEAGVSERLPAEPATRSADTKPMHRIDFDYAKW